MVVIEPRRSRRSRRTARTLNAEIAENAEQLPRVRRSFGKAGGFVDRSRDAVFARSRHPAIEAGGGGGLSPSTRRRASRRAPCRTPTGLHADEANSADEANFGRAAGAANALLVRQGGCPRTCLGPVPVHQAGPTSFQGFSFPPARHASMVVALSASRSRSALSASFASSAFPTDLAPYRAPTGVSPEQRFSEVTENRNGLQRGDRRERGGTASRSTFLRAEKVDRDRSPDPDSAQSWHRGIDEGICRRPIRAGNAVVDGPSSSPLPSLLSVVQFRGAVNRRGRISETSVLRPRPHGDRSAGGRLPAC